MSDKEQRRRAKHRSILDAALAEFARNGFSGASMQGIATRAGVSKPTLYQYFGQKQALLVAVLDAGKSELLAPFENAHGRPMVAVLWEFAWTYAAFVLRPDMLSLARLIIGEAGRLPDLARDYQRAGPLKALAGIAAYLETQEQAGAVTFQDAELAAQNLWALILSAPREHLLHNPDQSPDQKALKRHITNGLEVFLKAYSTRVTLDIAALADIASKDKRGDLHG